MDIFLLKMQIAYADKEIMLVLLSAHTQANKFKLKVLTGPLCMQY